MLDLEDAVAPDDKVQARSNVISALQELDWSGARSRCASTGSTRTTATATSSTWSSRAAQYLDTVLVPKAGCAGDIHLVATLLTQIEDAIGLERQIGISALIETAGAC